MIADVVGRLAAVKAVGNLLLIPADRRTELGCNAALGPGIAEKLAEDELAGADGPAEALACDAAAPQALVRPRRQAEGHRERGAAAVVRDEHPLVQDVRGAASAGDIGELGRGELAAPGILGTHRPHATTYLERPVPTRSRRRLLTIGLAASIVVHLAAALIVALSPGAPASLPSADDSWLVFEAEAPEAPDAFEPLLESEAAMAPEAMPSAAKEPAPEPEAPVEPPAPPEPETSPPPAAINAEPADATPVEDAGTTDAALDGDGPAGDAASDGDGGPASDAAPAGDAALDGDGGPASDAAPDSDGGPPGSALVADLGRDAGSSDAPRASGIGGDGGTPDGAGAARVDTANAAGPALPAWARLDFSRHTPSSDRIAVVVRLDRLRGTPWAALATDILAPMPDYAMIVGGRGGALAEHFDVLAISSSDPTDVRATNLAARSRLPEAALQAFLSRDDLPVTWSAARGGALGRIGPGPAKHPGDGRVYLMPQPSWIVLAHPQDLGELAAPAAALPADAGLVPAPTWVRELPALDAATAGERAPIAFIALRDLPRRVEIPRVGQIPGPSRLVAAIEPRGSGFFVRGHATFPSAAAASEFREKILAARGELTSSLASKALLSGMHVYNALVGLSLRVRGERLSFSTSVSQADGKAAMERAADWARRFFGRGSASGRTP